MNRIQVTLLLLAAFFISCDSPRNAEFTAVSGFDLSRYLGTWYEIARMPTSFERNLVRVTAHYESGPDGTVAVLN